MARFDQRYETPKWRTFWLLLVFAVLVGVGVVTVLLPELEDEPDGGRVVQAPGRLQGATHERLREHAQGHHPHGQGDRRLEPRSDVGLAGPQRQGEAPKGLPQPGPGLVGALMVGGGMANGLGLAWDCPVIPVHHMEGHLLAPMLEQEQPAFPFVALLVSGGHTQLVVVNDPHRMEILGRTIDDAAGEAFDKVAKLLGLGYPGGGIIDRLSKEGNPAKIAFTRPYLNKSDFDFSFSGIKTAVSYYVGKHQSDYKTRMADIAAGFQAAVVEVLAYKLINAARVKECEHIAVVGGVAANSGLRNSVRREAERKGLSVHIPSVKLCGDNAAMVAAAGYHYLNAGMQTRLCDDVFSRAKV